MAGNGPALSFEQRRALTALISHPIYELIPLTTADQDAVALPAGAPVTVTTSVRLGLDATLGLAERLSARGHPVAPHLAARLIRDRAHLADLVERMKTGGIQRLFIVGGDGPAIGEIRDGLTVIRLLAERGHHFDEIGVPGYPEGHPSIPSDTLLRDLRDKQPHVRWMTTQMSFNGPAVAAWIADMRRDGIALPIHLGIPGAVELGKLTRIAARIGVADAARYLLKQRGLIGYLMQRPSFSAESLLTSLARTFTNHASDVRALHVFTMNQVKSTLAWQQEMLERLS
jgi:methylenetetrahydrofolate reductase (NADPH)